jgi:hypothetical protein
MPLKGSAKRPDSPDTSVPHQASINARKDAIDRRFEEGGLSR